MSYSDITSEEIFSGDGANTSFAYTQNTTPAANLRVSILDVNGKPTPLTNGTHFDLSGVGGAGGITITYPSGTSPAPYDVPLLATEKLVAWLEPALSQSFSHKNNDAYAPSVLEQWMDDTRRQIQALETKVNRSFHVEVGSADPPSSTILGLRGANVLLATATGTASSVLSVISTNWPATYDRVELEVVDIAPPANAILIIQPVDNGTATATNLQSLLSEHSSAGTNTDSTRNYWGSVLLCGSGADDHLTGSLIVSHHNAGYISGYGNYARRTGTTDVRSTHSVSRHTTPGTRWDGFEVSFSATTITGTIRLWGFPKS